MSLIHIDNRNFRHRPAGVRARDLKLHHRNGVRWTTDNTEATTDTLLFVNNHIRPTLPGYRILMQRILLHHARETFHANTVIRADVHATRTKDTDRWIDHNIQLTLQT